MTNTYTLASIIATDTEYLRFIWTDGFEVFQAPGWTGWFRGVIAGRDDEGEYERYDGTDPFKSDVPVLDRYLSAGGIVEPSIETS